VRAAEFDPNAKRAMLSRMSSNQAIRLSEGKRRLAVDGLAEALLDDRFGNHIDPAAQHRLQRAGQIVEAAEIGEAAGARRRGQADDHVEKAAECGAMAASGCAVWL
jgi:hypothetical protein